MKHKIMATKTILFTIDSAIWIYVLMIALKEIGFIK